MNDICVENFRVVDIKDIRMPIIVVSRNPVDYPEYIVGRLFDIDKPTNIHIKGKDLKEVRMKIKEAFPWMISMQRGAADEEQIVEVWM